MRTAAWYIILQDNGLINTTLQALGLTDGPVPLIFNRLGVVIAMTHVLLPFMVLPIFSVLIGIPKNLMPAAASLGASPIRAFVLVLLPLSLRGVVSGGLLVFMSALGYYITPALIGGAKDQMISSVIAYYATGAANWGMAGSLGIVLLAATMILYASTPSIIACLLRKRADENAHHQRANIRVDRYHLSDSSVMCNSSTGLYRQHLSELPNSRLFVPVVS